MRSINFLVKKRNVTFFAVVILFSVFFQGSIKVQAETMDELSMPLSTFETFAKEMGKDETHYYKVEIAKAGTLRLQIDGFYRNVNIYGSDGSDIWSTYSNGDRDDKIRLETGSYYISLEGNAGDDGKYEITTSFTADKKTVVDITINLKKGKGIQLDSMISPKEEVVWKSSKSDTASVSQNGYIKTKKAGTCYIYATAKNSGVTDKIKIIVK